MHIESIENWFWERFQVGSWPDHLLGGNKKLRRTLKSAEGRRYTDHINGWVGDLSLCCASFDDIWCQVVNGMFSLTSFATGCANHSGTPHSQVSSRDDTGRVGYHPFLISVSAVRSNEPVTDCCGENGTMQWKQLELVHIVSNIGNLIWIRIARNRARDPRNHKYVWEVSMTIMLLAIMNELQSSVIRRNSKEVKIESGFLHQNLQTELYRGKSPDNFQVSSSMVLSWTLINAIWPWMWDMCSNIEYHIPISAFASLQLHDAWETIPTFATLNQHVSSNSKAICSSWILGENKSRVPTTSKIWYVSLKVVVRDTK